MIVGHDIGASQRTKDVQISDDISFDTMLLRSQTLNGLRSAGFLKPSPIQLHGIPLGKCGFDLLLEAKSGTGKTAVFTVIALEKLDLKKGVQTIMLAPTREIASQISNVITAIGSQYKDLNVTVVMGGLSFKEDIDKFKENVHIVVGSPGRLRHLIHQHVIDLSSVRLFVLDEADKLMESSFQPDINYIFSLLPKQKQVIMSSATYSAESRLFITKYVKNAQHICPDSNSVLLGIEQKVTIVPHNSNIVKQTKHRYEELKKILTGKQFKQCLIFCNYQVRVGELHRMLSRNKWPAEQLYGQQQQTDRLDALKTLQEYKCRLLVSTDLAARGIDASNVDLVINFEPPLEWQTYLHRIGRAGRYGSYGTAISIISDGKETTKFKETLRLPNIPFGLQHLWSDEPFDLNLQISEESLEINKLPVVNSPVPKEIINEIKENLLWKLLTAEESEHKMDDNHEITSFQKLCESHKISTEPSIESFSELIHSLTANEQKDCKKINKVEYQHVKVTNIPIDFNKYWVCASDKEFQYKYNILNCDDNISSKTEDSICKCFINFEKELMHKHNETDSSLNYYNDNYSKNMLINCDDISNNIHSETKKEHLKSVQGYINKSDKTNFDSSIQEIIDAGSPTAFGKPKYKSIPSNGNKNISKPNNHSQDNLMNYFDGEKDGIFNPIQGNKISSCELVIDPIEQAMVDAGLPTAFGKPQYKSIPSNGNKNISKPNNHSQDNLVNYFDEEKGVIFNPIDSNKNPCELEIEPIEQATVDAGLPTAFGKRNTINNNSYDYSNKHSKKNIFKHKDKKQPIKDQPPRKIESNISDKMKYYNGCLSNTVIKSNKSESSSDPDEESIQPDYSSKPSNEKQTSHKCRQHRKYDFNTLSNAHDKKVHFNSERTLDKSQQFDLWYNQLKRNRQIIQYTMYIEELRKL